MRKRVITSAAAFLTAGLILSGIVLSLASGQWAQIKERQALATVVRTLASTVQTTKEAWQTVDSSPVPGSFYVLAPDGTSLGRELPAGLGSNDGFRASLTSGDGTSQVNLPGESYLTAAARLSDGGALIVIKPVGPSEYVTNPMWAELLSALVFLGVSGIGLILLMNRRILEPLEEFSVAASRIAGGDLTSRIKVNENSELKGLAEPFNALADRLETTIIDSLGNQSQLEAILGSMNSGVIAVDKNNKIIIFNPFARRIFGIFTDAIGKDIRDVIRIPELEQMMTVSDQFQELSLKPDHSAIVRYKTTELISDRSEKRGKVTVIQDVTDLKKLEQMRTQFVANVSHELKTPLTSIQGFTETLRYVEDPATKIKFLDIIEAESERLRRLIEDILSLSAIENQESPVSEIIDAAQSTISAMSLLEVQARDKNIDLSLIIKGEPRFIGEEDMYRQVIINLVENAIKYTEKNGRVKVRLEEEEDQITLTVSDTGIGITAEHLPRLFERFYRVDKARDRAQGGTGLGLAIVKHIVITFGGTISVESVPGQGTTFTVHMPAFRGQAGQAATNRIESIKFNE